MRMCGGLSGTGGEEAGASGPKEAAHVSENNISGRRSRKAFAQARPCWHNDDVEGGGVGHVRAFGPGSVQVWCNEHAPALIRISDLHRKADERSLAPWEYAAVRRPEGERECSTA
jgi:hypothetical protein